jgi:hypothetical protein
VLRWFLTRLFRKNIELIESSMVALCFEDNAPSDTQENLLTGTYGIILFPRIHLTFHSAICRFGSGSSRWFDKSITMIVSAHGRMSWNAEHACTPIPRLKSHFSNNKSLN